MAAPERFLLRDLKALGIDRPDVLEQAHNLMALDIPYFTLSCPFDFPDGRLDMEMHCSKDSITGEWKLRGHTARFTRPIILPVERFAGIDVSSLDKIMANVDWSWVMTELPVRSPFLLELFAQMNKLQASGPEGKHIYDLLTIKHWSDTSLYDPRLADLKKSYTTEQKYDSRYPAEDNVKACYYLLSGRFDEYHSQLKSIGFYSPLYLKRMLAYSEGDFELTHYTVLPDGILKVTTPFTAQDGAYNMDHYQLTFYTTSPINDGIYNSVDTEVLQEEMKQIDWTDEDSHYIQVEGDEFMFNEEISRVVEQLHYILPEDPAGQIVSRQLQLKYWAESPDFVGIIEEDAWKYLSSLPCSQMELPVAMGAREGYQLLSGRAIWEKDQSKMVGKWFHVTAEPVQPGTMLLQSREGISSTQLNDLLQQLPCGLDQIKTAFNEIKKGAVCPVVLNNGQPVLVSVDPFQGQLKLFSTDGIALHHQLYRQRLPPKMQPGQGETCSPRQMKHLLNLIRHGKKRRNGM